MAVRAELESLLRARKLDVTLTTALPVERQDPGDLAPAGIPLLDRELGGGFRRGHLSEVVGASSSGRTSVLCSTLAAAAARGELVALIDTCDRFDPSSAAAAGLDLSRLLWIRDTGDAARALKAAMLVLQAGGFGVVAFDVADVRPPALRRFPFTTWLRLARVIEGSETVALLVAAERLARSPGGVTVSLDAVAGETRACWAGASHRARLLRGVALRPRVIRAR
jgi:recombination protein RecA